MRKEGRRGCELVRVKGNQVYTVGQLYVKVLEKIKQKAESSKDVNVLREESFRKSVESRIDCVQSEKQRENRDQMVGCRYGGRRNLDWRKSFTERGKQKQDERVKVEVRLIFTGARA